MSQTDLVQDQESSIHRLCDQFAAQVNVKPAGGNISEQ